MSARRSGASAAQGRIRIIGGRWRGRHLEVPDLPGLRPTPDRSRETLFNWLQGEVAGSHCLDLFAGTGALGLEAASRGAASVTLVEQDARAARALAAAVGRLQADQVNVVQADAWHWLQAAPLTRFDIAFVDPPFASPVESRLLALLLPRLKPDAWLYLEHAGGAETPLPGGFRLHRQARSRQTCASLLRRDEGSRTKASDLAPEAV